MFKNKQELIDYFKVQFGPVYCRLGSYGLAKIRTYFTKIATSFESTAETYSYENNIHELFGMVKPITDVNSKIEVDWCVCGETFKKFVNSYQRKEKSIVETTFDFCDLEFFTYSISDKLTSDGVFNDDMIEKSQLPSHGDIAVISAEKIRDEQTIDNKIKDIILSNLKSVCGYFVSRDGALVVQIVCLSENYDDIKEIITVTLPNEASKCFRRLGPGIKFKLGPEINKTLSEISSYKIAQVSQRQDIQSFYNNNSRAHSKWYPKYKVGEIVCSAYIYNTEEKYSKYLGLVGTIVSIDEVGCRYSVNFDNVLNRTLSLTNAEITIEDIKIIQNFKENEIAITDFTYDDKTHFNEYHSKYRTAWNISEKRVEIIKTSRYDKTTQMGFLLENDKNECIYSRNLDYLFDKDKLLSAIKQCLEIRYGIENTYGKNRVYMYIMGKEKAKYRIFLGEIIENKAIKKFKKCMVQGKFYHPWDFLRYIDNSSCGSFYNVIEKKEFIDAVDKSTIFYANEH